MIRVVNVRGLNKPDQRAGVCYVGRGVYGWPAHQLANPFKPRSYGAGGACQNTQQRFREAEVQRVLNNYRTWLLGRPVAVVERALADLWDECDHGAKPLGCWCVNATYGDGQPVVCHGQILGALLAERFCKEQATCCT